MSGPRDLAELEARAKAGDAQAQYLLSALLSRQGRKPESRQWLERAAAAGFADALYTQATNLLSGVEGVRDLGRAERMLREAVGKRSQAARRSLALMLALGANAPPDWAQAAGLIIHAALAGDASALREVGLLLEMAAPGDARAAQCLVQAARAGDGLAAFALLCRSAKGAVSASEAELAQWSAGLQRSTHPLRHHLLNIKPQTAPAADVTLDRGALVGLLGTPPGVRVPARNQVSERPKVIRFDRLMTVEECEYLAAIAMPQLNASMVTNPVTGAPMRHSERTSSTASLAPLDQDLVVYCLNLRLAAAAGLPAENGEMLSILRYEPGQEYSPHFDFLGAKNDTVAQFEMAGQRVRTLLVYLNTDYDGGETEFLANGLKVKGEVGDAVLFHNVDDAGQPDLNSRHAGLPVRRGAKWLASKWFRERAYRI